MLGNLDLAYYSKTDNHYTVAFMFEKDVKKFGFNTVMKTIVDNIKHLDIAGINVKQANYLGTLTCTTSTGDNLGFHKVDFK